MIRTTLVFVFACVAAVASGCGDDNNSASCSDGIMNGNETGIDCGGSCVACGGCTLPTDCPGTDGACQMRTCTAQTCGVTFSASGTATPDQTDHDCLHNQCDGAGNIVAVDDDTDLPEDSNPCTTDVCTAGVASHTPVAAGSSCGAGMVCDGAGSCVGCVLPTDCPGTDGECAMRSCDAGVCGTTFAASGTPTAAQTPGDCQVNQCDGAGNIVTVASATDVPPDDGNDCTDQVCNGSTPAFPDSAAGATCNQTGGMKCDGAGVCVECLLGGDCASGVCDAQHACAAPSCSDGVKNGLETDLDCGGGVCPPCADTLMCMLPTDCQSGVCTAGICAPALPTVVSTTPADAAVAVDVMTSVAVTFSVAMDPATLTAQLSPGACTASIQVSTDGFASCLGFAAAAPVMSAGNTVATLAPSPALSYGSLYQVRVTTAAQSAGAIALASQFTSATGFTSGQAPASCIAGSVVISQVYGGGGNTGAVFKNDFVELHNRGLAAVDLTGFSVQYSSATGTTWAATAVTPLTGTIQPGAYYLVQEGAGAMGTTSLPTPDATGTTAIASAAGKIALVNGIVPLTGACPTGASIVDFVGFGPTANCFEGTAPAPAPSNTTAVVRGDGGCLDANDNATDLVADVVNPRNSTATSLACSCSTGAVNETGTPGEADFCVLQAPTTLTVATGTSTGLISGRIFETGVTEAAGANVSVMAQIGYGPLTANPETQPGWTYTDAVFDLQVGNDDEYQVAFTAPAPGSYFYTSRFSLDGGATWTYCDANGAGSNAGLSFEVTYLPIMIVTP